VIYQKGQLPNLPKSELSEFDELILRFLDERETALDGVLNGGLRIDENFDGEIVSYSSNAIANTQDTVIHGLGKIPVGFLVIDIDKGGVVYRSATSDETNLYLKCSTATTAVTLFIF
jgi:hypothetical protein